MSSEPIAGWRRFFQDGDDYELGTGKNSWFDTNCVLPIVADKCNVDIVVYTLGPKGPKGNPNQTTWVLFQNEEVQIVKEQGLHPPVVHEQPSEDPEQPDKRIHMLHVGENHYMFLAQHK